jgi:hypothetical protein
MGITFRVITEREIFHNGGRWVDKYPLWTEN